MATLLRPGWKDAAIEKSVVITDCWEVFKIYTGRLAEWILFGCMIFNIVEMIPGMNLWPVLTNSVMVITIITLDIAGFGLNSMAEYARECGHVEAAKEASRVAKCLIGIMMVTLLLATSGLLFPMIKPYLVYGEDTLILVRVLLVVIYGHTIHKLRHITAAQTPPSGALEEIARLQQALEHATQSAQEWQSRMQSEAQEWRTKIATLETQIATLEASKTASENALAALQNAHTNAPQSDTETAPQGATNITLLRTQKRSSQRSKTRTTTESEKASKAMRCIRRNATINATELAQKAGISVSYARRLLSDFRAQNEAVNQ
jgi:ribosomal protein S25